MKTWNCLVQYLQVSINASVSDCEKHFQCLNARLSRPPSQKGIYSHTYEEQQCFTQGTPATNTSMVKHYTNFHSIFVSFLSCAAFVCFFTEVVVNYGSSKENRPGDYHYKNSDEFLFCADRESRGIPPLQPLLSFDRPKNQATDGETKS